MVIFDAIIAAVAAFIVTWLLARQRASEPVNLRMLMTLAAVSAVAAAALLATELLPTSAVLGALAIILGGLAGRFAAQPHQHT